MVIARNPVFWSVLISYSSHGSSAVAQDTCDEYEISTEVIDRQSRAEKDNRER